MDRNSFAILHPMRVRWSECDMHGIVFNANYFVYYDVAMYEWQRTIGQRWGETPDFVTVHAECDFLHPAKFDDQIDIGARCARIGSKSIDFETAVFRGRELLHRGKLIYVHVVMGSTEPCPIGQDLIDHIISFEKTAPLQERKATVGV